LASKGWTKEDVKRYLYENGRISMSEIKRSRGYGNSDGLEWARRFEKEGAVPAVRSPGDITVVVAGGDLSIPQHVYFPTWGSPFRITKEIKVPKGWQQQLPKTSGEPSK
jgi:hypothetical protein